MLDATQQTLTTTLMFPNSCFVTDRDTGQQAGPGIKGRRKIKQINYLKCTVVLPIQFTSSGWHIAPHVSIPFCAIVSVCKSAMVFALVFLSHKDNGTMVSHHTRPMVTICVIQNLNSHLTVGNVSSMQACRCNSLQTDGS